MTNYIWFIVTVWAFGFPFLMGYLHQTYQRDMEALPEAIYPDWMIKVVMVCLSIIWPVVLLIAGIVGIFSLPSILIDQIKKIK